MAEPTPSNTTRRRMTPQSIAVWVLVALVGAAGWTVLALSRGEEVSAVWMLAAALGSYAIGYRFYARFIQYRVLKADSTRATPAERLDNGVDFHPTDRRVLFGHHFAAIAGAGPLVGPILAAQMGYLPGTIWIIVGVIFAGAVQDMVTLFFSTRRDGRSLGQMARDEIGPVGGVAALIAVFAIMIILLAVLALVIVNALAHSPWGVFSIGMTIPIALFMGVYLRTLRPGKVSEVSVIGVALLLLAIVAGGWVADSSLADFFTLEPGTLVIWMVVYGFFASVLPVWLLLAPRDYLSTFMKVGTIVLLALGVVIAMPTLKMPAVTEFAGNGQGPVFAGSLFPFVFITIACGALSGFHSLVSSGTTPKMIQKETQIRMIGYGAMLTESFVAVMAMICACILDPGLYFAINSPGGVIGTTVDSASQAVANLGFTVTPDLLAQAAKDVEEASLLSRTGGAPTFALGMSEIFSAVIGGAGLKAFWYHFAIMFEALFILTTVDAGTRVGRFMLQDMLGNLYKPMKQVSWKPGVWFASAVVVGGWGYFLWVGVHDPLGGINQLFPLFGIANQLLAAVALAVCTTLLVKSGRLKWAWVTAVPLIWDVTVTLTASWQKIFSSDPKVGFFAQRDKYRTGIDSGQVLPPAKSMDDMHTIVTNSTVDGVLCALFALLIVVVLADAARVCYKAISKPESIRLAEAPYVESKLVAPAGMFTTKQEKAVFATIGAPAGAPDVEAIDAGSSDQKTAGSDKA
ncbi:carbon starvation protein A [Streptomyces sp. NBC_01619]|uniref:Carbon starvation CstA family protein n=1 Tax=Streptomyces pratisoli TaxID=3139917 RepID=A0ACC6QN57_9ACTN|nr:MULTISPECIES: carbon starvation CstA family protein [unclassified Streptomyces]MCX4513156.1 carbon starvation protein A [Streptomyces sp. NBC_01619]